MITVNCLAHRIPLTAHWSTKNDKRSTHNGQRTTNNGKRSTNNGQQITLLIWQ